MYQNAISQQFLANQGLEIESPDQFLALDSMLLNHRSSTTVDATDVQAPVITKLCNIQAEIRQTGGNERSTIYEW